MGPLPPPLGKAERFEGYTTFNVSKLGLPTAAAIDLIGGNLSQQILNAMVTMQDDASVEQWVESTLLAFKQALVYHTLYAQPKIPERLNELMRHTTAAAIGAAAKTKD